MRIGPVAFLFLVVGGWVASRAVMLWPVERQAREPRVAWAPPMRQPHVPVQPVLSPFVSNEVEKRLVGAHLASRLRSRRTEEEDPLPSVQLASFASTGGRSAVSQQKSIALRPAAETWRQRPKRFSVSAWALMRGDVSPGLATAGQLGGSQVGVRARLRLDDRTHLAARVSGPLRSNKGKEAALALDVMPFRSLPVTVTVERRFSLDGGGRDAFGIGVFGGFERSVGDRIRIDGYGQAGVVGLRSRDIYVDGAVRAERELTKAGAARVGAGAGLWGGAQPGASRLDVGPQIVLHAPLGPIPMRIGAEWRQRVAGKARPGSGPVLSLGADF